MEPASIRTASMTLRAGWIQEDHGLREDWGTVEASSRLISTTEHIPLTPEVRIPPAFDLRAGFPDIGLHLVAFITSSRQTLMGHHRPIKACLSPLLCRVFLCLPRVSPVSPSP